MSEGLPAFGRVDDEARVLRGVARRDPNGGVRRELEPFARMGVDLVVAPDGAEVDDLGLPEESDVDRVVQVVVAHEHVCHVVRRDAETLQRIEDERAALDHPGVHDDDAIGVADQADGPGDGWGVGVAHNEDVQPRANDLVRHRILLRWFRACGRLDHFGSIGSNWRPST